MKKSLLVLALLFSLATFSQSPVDKSFPPEELFALGSYYYPEQWDSSQWERDLKKMSEMGIKFTHFAEFAWAMMEPEEGKYDFEWLDRAVSLAEKYGLKVIYDAAHAFGVEIHGKSILNSGDMSTLSFHATKVFNTLEGGALVIHDEQTKKRIDYLKNFGFASETEVVAPGINSKMDEVRAAYGLLNLRQVDQAIEQRRLIAIKYRQSLKDIEGVSFFDDIQGVRHNYSYFPIFIDASKYGMTRDELYFKMKEQNVFGRRYFYPLISTFSTYRGLESAKPENLPIANQMASRVICLPMHHALNEYEVEHILQLIKK